MWWIHRMVSIAHHRTLFYQRQHLHAPLFIWEDMVDRNVEFKNNPSVQETLFGAYYVSSPTSHTVKKEYVYAMLWCSSLQMKDWTQRPCRVSARKSKSTLKVGPSIAASQWSVCENSEEPAFLDSTADACAKSISLRLQFTTMCDFHQ